MAPTKKERARLTLLAIALYAHAEAARERGAAQDGKAYAAQLALDFNMSREEIDTLSRLTAFGRGDAFTRKQNVNERLATLTSLEVAHKLWPQSWTHTTGPDRERMLDEADRYLSAIRELCGGGQ